MSEQPRSGEIFIVNVAQKIPELRRSSAVRRGDERLP